MCSFSLKKHIPAGAGLGGGSSMPRRSCSRCRCWPEKRCRGSAVARLRRELGSDVPFFLHGGTALGLGPGRRTLSAARPAPRTRALLVAPGVHSSTAEAYRDLSPRLTSIPLQNKIVSFQQEVWRGARSGSIAVDDNDFEEVVFARHPELSRIKERLMRSWRETCGHDGQRFGDFRYFRRPRAAEARARSRSRMRNVFPISFLSRAQYRPPGDGR